MMSSLEELGDVLRDGVSASPEDKRMLADALAELGQLRDERLSRPSDETTAEVFAQQDAQIRALREALRHHIERTRDDGPCWCLDNPTEYEGHTDYCEDARRALKETPHVKP